MVSSEVIKLVPIGKEERFLVHEALLASQSEHLRNLIEKTSGESSGPERELDIGNWGSETLGRFVEFVYTGDYHCPDPAPLDTPATTPEGGSVSGSIGEEEDVAAVPPSTESAQDSEAGELKQKFWLPQPQVQLLRGLAPLSEIFAPDILNPQRKLSAAEIFATKDFHPAEHDFEEVFLAHAKVYTIARTFEIEALCILALQRLLRTLVNIGPVPPGSALVGNFVELARYAYATMLGTQDPFRNLISQFAALNFTSMQTQAMRELMKGGGDFASDLMEKVNVTLVAGGELGRSSPREEELNKEMEGLKREALEARMKAEEYSKTIEGLKTEALEGRTKAGEDPMIEELKKEALKAKTKAREDRRTIQKLKTEVLSGSIKLQQDKVEVEGLAGGFLRDLKTKVDGFERELLEVGKSKDKVAKTEGSKV